MVVTMRVYGKELRTLIDSGATKCFVIPDCCLVGGLTTPPHDTFLELCNGEKALSRRLVQNTPMSVDAVTMKVDLTMLKLLHDVDIVLRMNWPESLNPLIDW